MHRGLRPRAGARWVAAADATRCRFPTCPPSPATVITTQWLAFDPPLPVPIAMNVTNAQNIEVGTGPAPTSTWGRSCRAVATSFTDVRAATGIGPIDDVPIIEFRW